LEPNLLSGNHDSVPYRMSKVRLSQLSIRYLQPGQPSLMPLVYAARERPSLDDATSDFDVSQRFVASYVVNLPVGRGNSPRCF
jgi:hypothetical protein